MDKFCEDCIHNEVCQYYAIPPHKDRCNDKDTLDDIIPQGEWIKKFNEVSYWYECDQCGERPARNYLGDDYLSRFCPNCGSQMQEGGAE